MTGKGFTLLEMLVCVSISALLLAGGIPAFTLHLDRTELRGERDRLVNLLNYGRSMAVGGSIPVVLCPAELPLRCSPRPDWHKGWLLFSDANRNREFDPGETLFEVGRAAVEDVRITSSQYRRRISFRTDGLAFGSNLTLRLCHANPKLDGYAVLLGNSGRSRSTEIPAQACSVTTPG